jgi:hypothetical protein
MATFTSVQTKGLGSTPATVFTAPSTCVIIGLNAANTYYTNLPITVNLVRGSTTTALVSNYYVAGGAAEALLPGNKLVLITGDTLTASTYATGIVNGFDIIVSALEGL